LKTLKQVGLCDIRKLRQPWRAPADLFAAD